jgi:hypothetical protein
MQIQVTLFHIQIMYYYRVVNILEQNDQSKDFRNADPRKP